MEIHFVSIVAFRTALDSLLKVKKGVYASVPAEICRAFQNIPIEQIRSNRDMILMQDDAIVIKLRLLTSPSGKLIIDCVEEAFLLLHVGGFLSARGKICCHTWP